LSDIRSEIDLTEGRSLQLKSLYQDSSQTALSTVKKGKNTPGV